MLRNIVNFFSIAFSTKFLSNRLHGSGELITVGNITNLGEALELNSFCKPDFATQWFLRKIVIDLITGFELALR